MSNKSFISSPVLQEFYKKALDKKWIKEDETIVKQASAPINISSDLEENIMTLVSHLNSLNMKKEATELVSNFFTYKQAASQFSELIDQQSRKFLEFAHRDDKELFPTVSGLGKIHTNLELQRKIIENLNHQPKFALAKELINIFKNAQEADLGDELEKADSQEKKRVNDKDDLEWEFADENVKQNSKLANEKLDELKSDFTSAVSSFYKSLTIPVENFEVNLNKLIQPGFAGAFATFSETDLSSVLSFAQKWLAVASEGIVTKESIIATLQKFPNNQSGYNGLASWVKSYTTPENAAKFTIGTFYKTESFSGTIAKDVARKGLLMTVNPTLVGPAGALLPSIDPDKNKADIISSSIASNPILTFNASSVWTVSGEIQEDSKENKFAVITSFTKNESLGLLADAIFANFETEWNQKISSEKLSAFSSNANLKLQELFNITNYVKQINSIPAIKHTTSYALQIINGVIEILASFGDFSKSFKKDPAVYYLGQLVNLASYVSQVGKLRGVLQKNAEELSQIQITTADKVIPDESLVVIQSNFTSSRALLGMYYKKNKETLTKEQLSQLIAQKNSLDALINILSKKETPSTFATIKQQILSNPSLAGVNVSSLEALTNFSAATKKNYLASVNITEASVKLELIKQADGFSLPGSKPVVPSGAPQGSGKAPVSKELTEGKKAVQRMQALLINLGNTLNTRSDRASYSTAISKLFLVGKNSTDPSQLDGAWGPNTASALKAAQEFKDATAIEVGPFLHIDDSQLKDKANKNSGLLATTIRTLGGSVAEGLSNVKGTILAKVGPGLQQGETALISENLNSLKNFNKFLVENKIFPSAQDGFTVDQWINDIFSGLYQLINDLYNNPSLSIKQNSKVLANLWKNIATEFNKVIKSFNIDVNSDEGKSVLLDGKSLENLPAGGPSLSNMRTDKSTQTPLGQNPSNMEGFTFDTGTPESQVPPFDGTKLIVSGNYFPQASNLYKGALIYDLMNKEQAVNTATRLFPNANISAAALQILFFNLNSNYLANLKNENGILTAEMPGKGRMAIASMPKYQQSEQMLANLYPVLTYRQFLWNLKNELTSASQTFQQAQPNLSEQIQIVHSRWVVLIEKHLEQLQNFLNR